MTGLLWIAAYVALVVITTGLPVGTWANLPCTYRPLPERTTAP